MQSAILDEQVMICRRYGLDATTNKDMAESLTAIAPQLDPLPAWQARNFAEKTENGEEIRTKPELGAADDWLPHFGEPSNPVNAGRLY